MKAPEIAKYVAMGGKLNPRPRPRQEMERRFPSVYLSVEETVQLMTTQKTKSFVPARAQIYALSSSWHSVEHPDPTGSTAKAVIEGMGGWNPCAHEGGKEGERLFWKEREGKREKREGEEDEEAWMEKFFKRTSSNALPEDTTDYPIYFQDFVSLHQQLHDKSRTPEQAALFEQGLSLLPCTYGSMSGVVYFLQYTHVPTEREGVTNKTPYHKRGWTHFESLVAAVKRKDHRIYLGPSHPSEPALTLELFEQVPLPPPAFQRLLEEKRPEEKTDENKEGYVIRFNNRKDDHALVANRYKDFMLDTQVRGRKKIDMSWKSTTTKEKWEMLGEYFSWIGEQPECAVEEVSLYGCALNEDSLPPVAAGLSALSSLRELELSRNNFGLSSLSALTCLRQVKVSKCASS
uniref:Uncharacterized protein n=1 Tax=Chromera velia CCMP2878 TaxID=1169474 RepID=A0A0G4EZV6_9ALVE|eukprot:Cvel_14279.t1-p1 / transcript=Cvel_14279.t1 / gene=Cvel_14279 / organism=Chromera_velia_CCMP2878 / gene_product=hypothetical protein / transcript_product=hypothetical protein / location=Cvel_scaffold1008:7887-9095(+) / protein_length=403 / sequence_SO=supercontig / SO=protein_coding / is_pseudo=false